ncbi:MAG TPA: hypothetical protein EYF96_07050 [Nitrospinaceae bacterium]|nr:hypothetical protein [Nitrospinaceae bacterium]
MFVPCSELKSLDLPTLNTKL